MVNGILLEVTSWLSGNLATDGLISSVLGALVISVAIALYEFALRPFHPRGMSRDEPLSGRKVVATINPIEEWIRMSETLRPGGAGMSTPLERQNVAPSNMSGWVGWVAFAGIMMVLLGTFHIIDGLIALFNDEYFAVTKSGLAVSVDFTTWGWVHVIGGIIVIAAGIGVFSGKVWARGLGVVVAMISAIVNLGFLSAYPIWSSIMILVDILVIWALTVHGGELRED